MFLSKHTKFFGILILAGVGLLTTISAHAQGGTSVNAPKILRVELDRAKVVIPCPPGLFPKIADDSCRGDFKPVKVRTFVENPYKQPFILKYEASAGRIVGQGENVYWNLGNVRPGTYQLSVLIDYGFGFSAPFLAEPVALDDSCCCLLPCTCPDVRFEKDAAVKEGMETRIRANIGGGTATDYNYDWSVDGGEIIRGQETSNIVVKAGRSGIMRISISISNTSLCADCRRDFSTEIEIKP